MAAVIGTLAVRIAAKTATFNRDVKGAAKSLSRISTAAAKVSKASAVAFAGLSASLGLVITRFAGFETSITRVGAVSGASAKQMQELESSARGLAKATTFSAKEVADGMSFMAMAGFEVNEIVGSMPSVLQLAAAGMVDLSTAADITTNILTGMGMEVSDLGKINDILVSAMTGSNVTMESLGQAFQAVGPIAKSAGIGFSEITAAIGLLGNAGIPAEKAGTALRNAIIRLVKQTPEASAALKRLGITALDSSGQLRPLIDIVTDLEGAQAGLNDMVSIFGVKAGPAMLALVGQGSEKFKTFKQRLDDSAGSAKKIADAMLRTLGGRFKIFISNLEELAIVFGKRVGPALKGFLDQITGVAAAIANLPSGVLDTIAKFALWGTAITGIVAGLSLIVTVLVPIVAAALPVIAVIALIGLGIIAAITVVGLLKKAWDDDLGGMKTTIIDFVNVVARLWDDLISGMTALWDGLISGIEEGWRLAKALFTGESVAVGVDLKNPAIDFGGVGGFEPDDMKDAGVDMGKRLKKGLFDGAEFLFNQLHAAFPELAQMIKDAILTIGQPGGGTIGGSTGGEFDIDKFRPKTVGTQLAGPAGVGGGGVVDVNLQSTVDSVKDDIRKEVNETVGRAALIFSQTILGAAGAAGEVIGAAMEGFKQGGPFGAIAGVVAEMITRTESFKETVNDGNEAVSELAEAFEPLAANVKPLAVLVNRMAVIIGEQLAPIFEALTPVFEGLFQVMRHSTITLLKIIRSIGEVWNFMVNAIKSVLEELPGFGKIADDFGKLKTNLSGINRQIKTLEELTIAQARAAGVEAEATEDVADEMRELREAMSNVPAGFRINLRRFQSTTGETGAPGSDIQGQGAVTFNIYAQDLEETARKLNDIEEFRHFTGGQPVPTRTPFINSRQGG